MEWERVDLRVRTPELEKTWAESKRSENAIAGAAEVVTKDVPPNAGVVGNPARVIRTVGADGE